MLIRSHHRENTIATHGAAILAVVICVAAPVHINLLTIDTRVGLRRLWFTSSVVVLFGHQKDGDADADDANDEHAAGDGSGNDGDKCSLSHRRCSHPT